MISIEINAQKLDVADDSTLQDVIELAKTYYIPGSTIGILKAGTKKEEATSEFRIVTTKGEFKIELSADSTPWNKFSHGFINTKAHWGTSNSLAFGPVETDILPERAERKYNRYDVFFGTGGYDAKNTYLMFAKDKHISDYGSPKDGIIGKIISGKGVIADLKQGG